MAINSQRDKRVTSPALQNITETKEVPTNLDKIIKIEENVSPADLAKPPNNNIKQKEAGSQQNLEQGPEDPSRIQTPIVQTKEPEKKNEYKIKTVKGVVWQTQKIISIPLLSNEAIKENKINIEIRRCASLNTKVSLKLNKKAISEKNHKEGKEEKQEKIYIKKKKKPKHKQIISPIKVLEQKKELKSLQNQVSSPRNIVTLSSTVFYEEPVNVNILAEYYNRIKDREILKQLKYNFRYQQEKNFDITLTSSFYLANNQWIVTKRQNYIDLENNACQPPCTAKGMYLMLRHLYFQNKKEYKEIIDGNWEKEASRLLDHCFEYLQDKNQEQQLSLNSALEIDERKKATENIKNSWYKSIDSAKEEDNGKGVEAKKAELVLCFQNEDYKWEKLIKNNKESSFIKEKKIKKRKRSIPNIALGVDKALVKMDHGPTVLTESEDNQDVSVVTEANRDVEKEAALLKQKTVEILNECTSLKGEAGKDVFKGEITNKTQGNFAEKINIKLNRQLNQQDIAFNLKDANLEYSVPLAVEKNDQLFETIDEINKNSNAEKEIAEYSLTEGIQITNDANVSALVPKEVKLLSKLNEEFRIELLARMNSFKAFTESEGYNSEMNRIKTINDSQESAYMAANIEILNSTNKVQIIDSERISFPFIFEGSNRLNKKKLTDIWLPLKDEKLSSNDESDKEEKKANTNFNKKKSRMWTENTSSMLSECLYGEFSVEELEKSVNLIRNNHKNAIGGQDLTGKGDWENLGNGDFSDSQSNKEEEEEISLKQDTPKIQISQIEDDNKGAEELKSPDNNTEKKEENKNLEENKKEKNLEKDVGEKNAKKAYLLASNLVVATPEMHCRSSEKLGSILLDLKPKMNFTPTITDVRENFSSKDKKYSCDTPAGHESAKNSIKKASTLKKLARQDSQTRLKSLLSGEPKTVKQSGFRRQGTIKSYMVPSEKDGDNKELALKAEWKRRRKHVDTQSLPNKVNPAILLFCAIRRIQFNDVFIQF